MIAQHTHLTTTFPSHTQQHKQQGHFQFTGCQTDSPTRTNKKAGNSVEIHRDLANKSFFYLPEFELPIPLTRSLINRGTNRIGRLGGRIGAENRPDPARSSLQLIMAQGVGGGVCGRRAHLLLVGERVLAGELLDGVGLRCRGSLVRAAADARR